MEKSEKIINIIEEKIADLEYQNNAPRMSDSYYLKNDAKIQVLEEILRTIEQSE